MAQKIVAANWKMNLNFQEANTLISEVTNILKDEKRNTAEVIFAVPFVYVYHLSNFLKTQPFAVAAQNCSEHEKGAYTGEISAQMLASVGAKWVIVGHSERRLYYHETYRIIAEKIQRALQAGLKVIFCCGESLEIRNKNEHIAYVQNQLEGSLAELSVEQMKNIVIAYEPVWAIGTGKNATAEQAQEMHAVIRAYLKKKFGSEIAQNTSILYGGSVNAQNAKSLFSCPDVDGGLVGGASLKAREFAEIVKVYN
ncbi:triose-phosphate isomerase [Raineya orbicola]|jgi:triosephosphate isomerase|uniref:Triosephosphate isomerase n=1 Tax=Raineya orbicola TaxID=2016530 RepID=A0A2N3ICJ9_9BACT|nr:triose-phosphate isomerase [Raineya orbicola]PKQ68072.1 tim: triose-phosphate isomerase [Raineya orbicola]